MAGYVDQRWELDERGVRLKEREREIPFWENSVNALVISDPVIVAGLNIIQWGFMINAMPNEVVVRMKAHVQKQYDDFVKSDYARNNNYWDQCGYVEDMRRFLEMKHDWRPPWETV